MMLLKHNYQSQEPAEHPPASALRHTALETEATGEWTEPGAL
jgi:hypothetical protein